MDPDSTIEIVRDVTASAATRAEAALHLLVWIARGGYAPRFDGDLIEQCAERLWPAVDALDDETAVPA